MSRSSSSSADRNSPRPRPPKRRAALESQAIGRNVIRCERDGLGQIILPAGQRLARRGKDQIERHVQTGLRVNSRPPRESCRDRMVAFQHPKLGGIERLCPETDTSDAVLDQHANDFRRDISRICLDREFPSGSQNEPATNRF